MFNFSNEYYGLNWVNFFFCLGDFIKRKKKIFYIWDVVDR